VFACIVNVSAGPEDIGPIAAAATATLLDTQSDVDHQRSVLTLAGPLETLWRSVTALSAVAVATLDLGAHRGVHPRIGVVDVVPWVDLDNLFEPVTDRSRAARDRFARWAAEILGVPCYLYGPERSLPQVRADAHRGIPPDVGASSPHPTAGAMAVGARGALVAYNLWLVETDLGRAKAIAADIRRPGLRTFGFAVGDHVQVSCNLTQPTVVGPAAAYDLVAARSAIARAELVGLLPQAVLDATPPERWAQLDLSPDQTLERRLEALSPLRPR
jgi:glutamate formiminotransferase